MRDAWNPWIDSQDTKPIDGSLAGNLDAEGFASLLARTNQGKRNAFEDNRNAAWADDKQRDISEALRKALVTQYGQTAYDQGKAAEPGIDLSGREGITPPKIGQATYSRTDLVPNGANEPTQTVVVPQEKPVGVWGAKDWNAANRLGVTTPLDKSKFSAVDRNGVLIDRSDMYEGPALNPQSGALARPGLQDISPDQQREAAGVAKPFLPQPSPGSIMDLLGKTATGIGKIPNNFLDTLNRYLQDKATPSIFSMPKPGERPTSLSDVLKRIRLY
jgi:hypothetical protein